MTHPAPAVLNRLLDPGLPVWLLVDPILGEPLADFSVPSGLTADQLTEARARAWQREIQPINLPAAIDLPQGLHPYLVAMNGPDDLWLSESLDMAKTEVETTWQDGLAGSGRAAWRLGGWLQSERGADRLAETLAGLMQVRTTVVTRARYLRLADRRTLDSLCWIVGAPRLAAAFGTVRRWAWLDSCSQLQSLQHSSQDSDQALVLNATQWATLTRTELIHPCVARWLGEISGEGDSPRSAQQALQRADAAIQAAQRATRKWPVALASADHIVAWAAMSLLDPGFDSHPSYAKWLSEMTNGSADAPPEGFNIYCHELRATLARQTETAS